MRPIEAVFWARVEDTCSEAEKHTPLLQKHTLKCRKKQKKVFGGCGLLWEYLIVQYYMIGTICGYGPCGGVPQSLQKKRAGGWPVRTAQGLD